ERDDATSHTMCRGNGIDKDVTTARRATIGQSQCEGENLTKKGRRTVEKKLKNDTTVREPVDVKKIESPNFGLTSKLLNLSHEIISGLSVDCITVLYNAALVKFYLCPEGEKNVMCELLNSETGGKMITCMFLLTILNCRQKK
ncbi:unnamed protein product, partial [Meganyctiphanes norvegica]